MQHQDCFGTVDPTFQDLFKVDVFIAAVPLVVRGE
jgi:hypothetical protein